MSQQRVVVDALRKAGFSEDMIPTMVGISGAESGFNPQAHNPNADTGDNSYGLFQINMLGGMGPERRAEFGLKTNEELFDPYKNAEAAKRIYDQQGLGAWSVYRSGAYKDFVPGQLPEPQGALPEQNNQSVIFNGPQQGQAQATEAVLGDTKGTTQKPELRKKNALADKLRSTILTSVLQDAINPFG